MLPYCFQNNIAIAVKLFRSIPQGFAILSYGLLDHITIFAKLCRSMIQSFVILPYRFQNHAATPRSSAEACTTAWLFCLHLMQFSWFQQVTNHVTNAM